MDQTGKTPQKCSVSPGATHLDFLSVAIRLRVKASWEEERRKKIAEVGTNLVFFQQGVDKG